MGRELRWVREDWEHPKNEAGSFIPLFGGSCSEHQADWDLEKEAHPSSEAASKFTFEEWEGPRPDPAHYMPDWPDAERTHCMIYEDTSEGTPLSERKFETAEEAARFAADEGLSAWGYDAAPYEWWLGVLRDNRFSGLVISTPAHTED